MRIAGSIALDDSRCFVSYSERKEKLFREHQGWWFADDPMFAGAGFDRRGKAKARPCLP